MKVLLIAHNATVEGAGIAYANIIKALRQNGIEVVAVVPGYKGVYELLDNVEGVKRYVIPQIRNEVYPEYKTAIDYIKYVPKLIRSFFFRKSFKKQLREIVEKEKPDIIHSNTGTLRVGASVAREKGIPHVWHVRECQVVGYDFRPFGGEKKVQELFSEPNNHCIAITKSVYEYYHLTKTKDVVIYDGVFGIDDIPHNKTSNKEKSILYVGLLSEKKGVKMLLDAFSEVADKIPDYRLKLAGVNKIGIEGLIGQSPYKDRIQYLGFRKDIYDLMSSAKMVVVPSDYEGFGFITAEAMLNHTLVLGRNTAGTKEQMDNARELSGMEVALRFNTVGELSEKLIEACSLSDETYCDMTNKAFKVVTDLYTREKNGEEIIKFYHSVLNN